MKKLRLNEKIGLVFGIANFIFLALNIWVNPLFIIGQVICLLGVLMFLSVWGLTTFNDKYE